MAVYASCNVLNRNVLAFRKKKFLNLVMHANTFINNISKKEMRIFSLILTFQRIVSKTHLQNIDKCGQYDTSSNLDIHRSKSNSHSLLFIIGNKQFSDP